MKLFGKLKDIFYDVEYVEEEVKTEKPKFDLEEELKEEKHEDTIPKMEPIEEEKHEDTIPEMEPVKEEKEIDPEVKERELFQNRKTFKFPILDEEEEEKPLRNSSVNVMDFEQDRQSRINIDLPKKKESGFKPSPVISPIYGVIEDNDNSKEDVIREKSNKVIESSDKDIDTVRKKAFSKMGSQSIEETEAVLEEVNRIEEELEKLEVNNKREKINNVLEEIEEEKEEILEETKIEETIDLEKEDIKEEVEDTKSLDEVGNKTLEHDLFNLIDSMYEKEEE